jgi:hypothetical protein
MTTAKIARIRKLNDLARSAMGVASRVIQTEGIMALPAETQSKIRERVETYAAFDKDNDPYDEHDFGAFFCDEVRDKVFWKIDYFDKAYEFGSEDPSDPAKTTRVLTIMLASEY